jgi:hypothetical protein
MQELDHSGKVPAKKIYTSWGVDHVSIDINGQDGALALDLDHPIPTDMTGIFVLVTNYGTIEHVNNQFQAFKNVDEMVRRHGIMIHTLPPPKNWPNHGRYYYPVAFVVQLAKACNYEIVNLTIRNCYSDARYGSDKNLMMVAFMKTRNGWIDKAQFGKLPLLDTGDLTYTGNYTKHISRPKLQNRMVTYARRYLGAHPRLAVILRRCRSFFRSLEKRTT